MSNYTPESAYSVYRNTGQFYRALISRPTETIKRYTIATVTEQQVLTKGNPHTVTIRNLSGFDLRFGHDTGLSSATNYLTLLAGEERKFEYHISGYELVQVGRSQVLKAIFHCEWSDDMYIYNPGGGSAVVEVLVVG